MTAWMPYDHETAFGSTPSGGSFGYRPRLYDYGPQVRRFWFNPYMHIADEHEFARMQNIAIARAKQHAP